MSDENTYEAMLSFPANVTDGGPTDASGIRNLEAGVRWIAERLGIPRDRLDTIDRSSSDGSQGTWWVVDRHTPTDHNGNDAPIGIVSSDVPRDYVQGEDGITSCGDLMDPVGRSGRRLCGGCSRLVDVTDEDGRIWGSQMANPLGCREILERRRDRDEEPLPGWEDRAVERAQREGVL